MPTFQEDLTVNGDIFLKQNNYVSLHYGNRGRLGATPTFNPDNDQNGLWLEASADGSESGGLFCNGNTLVLWSPGDNDTLRIYDEDDFSKPKLVIDQEGKLGVGTAQPRTPLHVVGNRIRLENAGKRLDLRADGAAVDVETTTSDLYLRSSGAGNDIVMNPFAGDGNVGIGTGSPQAKLHVQGNLMVSGDIVLQNADCAEEFDLAVDQTAEPGTVMVLNDAGQLQPSTTAYDKRVAGIVSGAGDYKPGLVLDRQPEQSNRAAIALVGKVFCKVDASQAPIEVGDLLTTAPTPGHAMKATDPLYAFGAVIGKALQPLRSGTGLIAVLVALQ